MELAEPAHSNLDVHFRVGRIPGRVHWSFWVFTAILGIVDPNASLVTVSLWIAAVFVSILVHELGHAFAAKAYGMAPRIVLYGMGGVAVYRPVRQSWISRVLIAAAGPGAGFMLAGLIVLLGVSMGYAVRLDPLGFRVGDGTLIDGRMGLFIRDLLFVNVFWGLLNLLPIQPLDGGNITATLLARFNPKNALERSFQISMYVSLVVTIVMLVIFKSVFMTVMFAALAYSSYNTLLQVRGR